MIKFLFSLAILVIVIVAISYIIGRVFLHMPRALQFKSEKEGGIFSEKWMKWLEETAPQPLGEIIYEYVIPRKTRQVRYTKLHKVHFHAVINDKFYDTDIATEFWIKYTDFLGSEPCAKHYYRTQNGEFFCVTARLGKKDEFSAVPEKEMKKLLRNEPALYAAYIPHASENKDLREFALRQKKKEEEEKAKEQEENNAEDIAANEKDEKKKINKEEIKHSVRKAAGLFSESIEKLKKIAPAKKDATEDEIKKDICKTIEQSENEVDVAVKKESDIAIKPSDVQKNANTEEKAAEQKEEQKEKHQEERQEEHQEEHQEKLPEKEIKKSVPEAKPENIESEDMDLPMDMMEAYISAVEVEEEQTKKPKEKKKKKSTDIPENKIENKKAEKPEDKKQSDKTVTKDSKEDINTKKDPSNVSENTAEKPKKPVKPKRQKRSIRGPQSTENNNDIGFDNMDAVEKQLKFEEVAFTEPTQEEDEIEMELEKEEASRKEKENKKKLDNLDKAMNNMPRYRTVAKEE